MRIPFALSILTLLASCAPTPARPVPQTSGNPHYQGDVVIRPDSATLQASWTISFVADSTSRDSVVLLLNGGLGHVAVTGADVASFRDTVVDGDRRVVARFKSGLPATRHLAITYSGKPVFGGDGINRITTTWVELGLDSFWFPVFAGLNKRITGTWSVRGLTDWSSVASGVTEKMNGTVTFTNTTPLIDLAFSAAPSLRMAETATTTVYHVNASDVTVQRVLRTTDACAGYLNERYGAREKLPHARITIAPRQGPGYARKNYIVVTDVAAYNDVAMAQFLCHELAHFWSSGAVSAGPENWLNEAFAEYVAGRYIRDRLGAEAYRSMLARWEEAKADTAPVWQATLTKRPGPRIAYRKAPFLLDALEQRIGREKMDRVLERYMTARLATTPMLLQAIAEVATRADADWFAEQLAH